MKNYRFELNNEELKKWFLDSMYFLAPLAIMYISFVQGNINNNGFQSSDFVPDDLVIGGMILYILNTAFNFFKKFVSGAVRPLKKKAVSLRKTKKG